MLLHRTVGEAVEAALDVRLLDLMELHVAEAEALGELQGVAVHSARLEAALHVVQEYLYGLAPGYGGRIGLAEGVFGKAFLCLPSRLLEAYRPHAPKGLAATKRTVGDDVAFRAAFAHADAEAGHHVVGVVDDALGRRFQGLDGDIGQSYGSLRSLAIVSRAGRAGLISIA